MARRNTCTCNAIYCTPGSGHEDYCGLDECGHCGEFGTHRTENCPDMRGGHMCSRDCTHPVHYASAQTGVN